MTDALCNRDSSGLTFGHAWQTQRSGDLLVYRCPCGHSNAKHLPIDMADIEADPIPTLTEEVSA